MKIVIDRSKFISALNIVKDGVGNDAIPVIQNIKLETQGDDLLVLTTTNLDIVVSTAVQCKIVTPGATTVPAKRFIPMVNAFSDPMVEFEESDNKAVLTSGEVTYRIATISASEFPAPTEVSGRKMSFKQSEFKDMIRKTSYAASQDSTRRSLMTMCVQGTEDGSVVSVCSDGRRLASYLKHKDGVESFEMLIPPVAVKFLQRSLDGDDDVDIVLAPGKAALFQTKGWAFQTKLIADQYPNWRNVVPPSLANHIPVARDRFIECVRQASIASSDVNTHIVVSIKDGVMSISAEDSGASSSKVMIPVKYSGEELKVNFNPKYVLDVLGSLDDDEVSLNINDGGKPVTITCNDSGIVAVVMPLRIV